MAQRRYLPISPAALGDFRRQANLNKAELARRVGVSHQAVGQWESGQTSPVTNAIAVASAPNIPVAFPVDRAEMFCRPAFHEHITYAESGDWRDGTWQGGWRLPLMDADLVDMEMAFANFSLP
jgi:DNA-binding XRE family transcriptional regulator